MFNSLVEEMTPQMPGPAARYALGVKLGMAIGLVHCGKTQRAVALLTEAQEIARKAGVKRKVEELIIAIQNRNSA